MFAFFLHLTHQTLKNFLLLALLFATLCFVGCDDDDDASVCTPTDWTGNYTGTFDCDNDSEFATANITASGTDAIVIEYRIGDSTSFLTTTYAPIVPVSCRLNDISSDSTGTVDVSATLNGDQLVIVERVDAGTVMTNCTLNLTRN